MHINDLPVEVLSVIFDVATSRNYLTPNALVPLLSSFRKRSAPFNLIHVCQHWRVVAFSTPTLWIFLNGAQHRPFRPSIPAMTYWLQCSRNAPLHFRISSWQDARGHPFNPKHAREMLRLFAKHLHRWQSLSIEAGNDLAGDFTAVLRDAGEYQAPLESLEIELGYGDVQQSVADKIAFSIHKLKTLRRLHWMHPWGQALPHLPWDQYDTISVRTSFVPEESLRLVAQCVSARSITIRGSHNSEHPLVLSDQPHTFLTLLTSLTLDQSSDPLPFLSCFTLPSLCHLEIGLYQRNFFHLEAFLKRSNCPLQVLVVIDTTLSADDVANFFQFPWIKQITNVKLGPTHSDEKILRFMEYFERACIRLPPLVVWKEGGVEWPMFIGWKESWLRGTYYLLQDGQLIHATAR